MSAYHGRRAPNVSQYLANLNTIPSPHELAAQQQTDLAIDDEGLDFLTNAEFFDFDALNVDFHDARDAAGHAVAPGPQQYQQFQPYPASMSASPNSVHNGFQGHYPAPAALQSFPPRAEDKAKASAPSAVGPSSAAAADLEEQSRMAAEEDKRRRNTAASARFRVKKKQREQALEKQAREMADKLSALEDKITQLEMENKWLKGLITDKHDGKSLEDMRREREANECETQVQRSTEDRKDGVGTAAPAAPAAPVSSSVKDEA